MQTQISNNAVNINTNTLDIATLNNQITTLTLDSLTDVDTTTIPPTNGQVLLYDETNNIWVPFTVTSGPTSLGLLSDVLLGSLSDEQLLTYD